MCVGCVVLCAPEKKKKAGGGGHSKIDVRIPDIGIPGIYILIIYRHMYT